MMNVYHIIILIMGVTTSSESGSQYNSLLSQFQIIQECRDDGLLYLQSKSSQQQFLIREVNCHDHESYKATELLFKKRQQQLAENRHIASLIKVIKSEQNQYCMTFYKIYMLWEYPQRTLEDQINQRILQKRTFLEKELWSILASCILGLSHLQRQDIKHNSLRSGTILINHEGIVKISDPISTGSQSNYEKLLTYRSHPHLYLSPQQTDSLRQERTHPQCDPFKSDIWTLGMTLLEAGLLSYQDNCYRDQYSRVHWDTLEFNINRFQEGYSPQLANLLQIMLARDERARPDWAELEEHVITVEEDASQVSPPNITRLNPLQENSIDKIFAPIKSTSKFKVLEPQVRQFYQRKSTKPAPVQGDSKQTSMRVSGLSQQQQILYPSDISSTRPLRNTFPTNTYVTLTQIDQSITLIEDNSQSRHQKSSSHLLDATKAAGSSTPHQTPYTQRSQNEYVCQRYKQGSRYEGHKLNGMKHGVGRYYYQDGGMYEGEWKDGHMEGFGRLYYKSEKVAYQGQWRNDQFSGKGTLYNQLPEYLKGGFDYHNFNQIEQHWTKYQGDFVQDMKHGRGILLLSNGQYFEGQFCNDYVEGIGTYVTVLDTKVEGRWKNNMMQ